MALAPGPLNCKTSNRGLFSQDRNDPWDRWITKKNVPPRSKRIYRNSYRYRIKYKNGGTCDFLSVSGRFVLHISEASSLVGTGWAFLLDRSLFKKGRNEYMNAERLDRFSTYFKVDESLAFLLTKKLRKVFADSCCRRKKKR